MEQHTDLASRLRWGAVTLAAAATIAVGSHVAAAYPSAPGSRPAPHQAEEPAAGPFQACLRAGPTTPDRVEARAAECRLRTEARYAAPAYVTCLRNAAGTADAMERWADACLVLTER